MRVSWSFAVALTLFLVSSCSRSSQSADTGPSTALDRACRTAAAASAGNDTEIQRLQQALRDERTPSRAAEQLGYRFITRARLSNDAGFYTLAEQAALCMASIDAADPAALLLRGHVLHQMHRFGEAELIARRLVAGREYVLDYGLLGDALMEQGRLTEAATVYQKMIDLKPFYQSYTRAAHLRWLKGDLDGAIEMMQAAIKAASPRDPESVAWAYSRLGFYELQRGRLTDAERMIDASRRYLPDYAAALLVHGWIQLARGARIALKTPIEELGGDQQIVGVYATTSRRRVRILGTTGDTNFGDFVQVARQGNPLFNEGLVAIRDKDLYSRTSPEARGRHGRS
ncbi:MAG TPA: DUF4331 family protein [Vicinamibacterales bacterium]|nr:DUF4331 family protein [Vicinamibacterales bacterium]